MFLKQKQKKLLTILTMNPQVSGSYCVGGSRILARAIGAWGKGVGSSPMPWIFFAAQAKRTVAGHEGV